MAAAQTQPGVKIALEAGVTEVGTTPKWVGPGTSLGAGRGREWLPEKLSIKEREKQAGTHKDK